MLLLWCPLQAMAQSSGQAAATASADTLPFFEVKKNGWLAAGEVVGLNMLIWSYDRFIRDEGENPGFRIGFNSWSENLKNGFEWDDNNFTTNQFAHPYHGSLYFNAARSNGFDYWGSLPFAFGGSLMWEYVMENHHPSWNDWVATSMGGAALGESLHRLSAMVWDNTARGSGRTWREIGGFLVNPMGGLNRLFTGQASKVQANPVDRYPNAFRSDLDVGMRSFGDENLWNANKTRLFFRAAFAYGDPFAGEIKHPFDAFDFDIQLNFGDVSPIGRAGAKGILFMAPLSETENSQHLVGAYHHYDYINNSAYEYGGQSLSASYISKVDVSPTTVLTTLHADGVVLGATKSDYADFTGRSYAYGPGLGFKFSTSLLLNNKPLFTMGHSSHWIYVVNGDAATHYVSMTYARLDLRLHDIFGLGMEYDLYNAERNYEEFADVSQRTPEFKVYMNWMAD